MLWNKQKAAAMTTVEIFSPGQMWFFHDPAAVGLPTTETDAWEVIQVTADGVRFMSWDRTQNILVDKSKAISASKTYQGTKEEVFGPEGPVVGTVAEYPG